MRILSKLIQRTNDIQLRNKLITSFILVVFIPVMIVGFFLTNELRKGALKEAVEQTTVNMERVQQRVHEILKVPIDISNKLLFDDRLKYVVDRQYETIYQLVQAYRNYPDFQRYVHFSKEVENIKFYTENETMLLNWEFFPVNESIKNSAWYQSAFQNRGSIEWHYLEDETRKNEKFLSLVRKVDTDSNTLRNVLVITVNKASLNSAVSSEQFNTLIVDDEDHIITTNRADWRNQKATDIFPDFNLLQPGTYELAIEGKQSKVMVERLEPESSINGLRIIMIFAVDSIMRDANKFSLLGMTVIFVSVVGALFLIYGVSLLLTGRLLKLSKHIGRVARGDLDTTLTIDGNDEIGQLSRQFNFMVRSVKELMQEVQDTHMQKEQLELKQNEIKLKMMASQINPHFLFNALESIRMKAHIKGESEIAGVVKTLGRLMRKNLEVGGNTILLRDEIEIVRSYLEIQQFRYEDRLKFTLDVDPATEKIYIPPLIIQPLVENAVIHGLEGKENGGGELVVTTQMKDGFMQIQVNDNGVGIPPAKLQAILELLEKPDGSDGERIGLKNVHQRLQLHYGRPYGLNISSQSGVGTTVYFKLPAGGNPIV